MKAIIYVPGSNNLITNEPAWWDASSPSLRELIDGNCRIPDSAPTEPGFYLCNVAVSGENGGAVVLSDFELTAGDVHLTGEWDWPSAWLDEMDGVWPS